jgi:hypothetical protein
VNPDSIVAVQHTAAQRCKVILADGIALEASEDSHVINKRIEDFTKFGGAETAGTQAPHSQ